MGRAAEVRALDDVLADARRGLPAAVLLTGAVGMGKTALLDVVDAHARADGFAVPRTLAPPGSGCEPWTLLRGLLPPLLAHAPPVAGAGNALPALVAQEHGEGDPASAVAVVARELALLARAAADVRPLLLVLDDLQWADDESLAVLSLASAGWVGAPVAVAGAWRGDQLDSRLQHWRVLHLTPLALDDAVTLLRASTRVPLCPDRARRLADRLGRCPLALTACDRVLSAEQVAGSDPLPDPVPLDEHLRLAWADEVGRLPPRTRAALAVVCVLATTRLDLLVAVLRAEGLDLDDLDAATLAGLLSWPGPERPSSAPATCGPLLVSAVRGTLDRRERHRLHRLAADQADALGLPAAVVVRHLVGAAEPGDEQVAAALGRAADRAHRLDQPGVAVAGWEAAARTTLCPRTRVDHALQAARTWLTESTAGEGAPRLAALLTGLDLSPDEAVWREWLRAEALASTDLAASAAALAEAARHARRSEPSLVGHLLWAATVTSWLAGVPRLGVGTAQALDEWVRATPGAGSEAGGLPAWAAPALLGTARLQEGDVTAGAPLVTAARHLAAQWQPDGPVRLGTLVDVVALDDVLLLAGDAADRRLDDLAARLTDDATGAQAGARLAQAWRARRRGDWTLASCRVDQGQALARSVRARAQELSALALVTELDALTGAPAFTVHCEALRQRAGEVGDRLAAAHADRAAGLAALAAGSPEQAVPLLQQAASGACLGRGVADAPLAARVDLVEACSRAGDEREARQWLEDLQARLGGHPDPSAPATLHRCRALVAHADADEEFDASLRTAPPCGDPFELARTRLLLGEHLRRTRRPTRARGELAASAVALRGLGARPWLERATRELRAAGGDHRSHAPPASGRGSRLTPQEWRVAVVVADGATTREAAQALVLSPRTVEFHLANAYRKLGVGNRAGLARAVREAAASVAPGAVPARGPEPGDTRS